MFTNRRGEGNPVFRTVELTRLGRNVGIYLVGIGFAVVGALGIAKAIELSPIFAWPALVIGLALVLVVHEFLDGPI